MAGSPLVFTDFTTKPNGATPLVTDSGQPVVLRRTAGQALPVIENGKWVAKPNTNADGYATYYQVMLGSDGNRVGCTYTVPADTNYGTTTCIGLWGNPLWEGGYGGAVPQSRAHLVVNPGVGTWVFGIFDGTGTVLEVANGAFTPLAYDDTAIWRQELFIDEATDSAYITLPDETTAVVTPAQMLTAIATRPGWTGPSRMSQLAGHTAFVEHFAASNGLTYLGQYPNFLTFWADAVGTPGSVRGTITATKPELLKQAEIARTVAKQPTPSDMGGAWAPATVTDVAVPAYPGAEVNAAASITVTAPTSGRLLIEATGCVVTTGAGDIIWELHDSAPTTWPALRAVVATGASSNLVRLAWHINAGANVTRTYTPWHFYATGGGSPKAGIAYPLVLTARPMLS